MKRSLLARAGIALGALAGVALVAVAVAVPYMVAPTDPAGADALASVAVTVPVPDPEPEPPTAPRRRLLAPERGVYLGVSNHALAERTGAVADWAELNGTRPRIVNWFQQWLSGERRFRPDWARRVARAGAVPMITWEPWSAPEGERHQPVQPDISLARIAAGDHDEVIRAWARDVAAYRGPVLIRPMHEMNGNWYPWAVTVNGNSPADYVAAWRHIHRVFDRAGADNVSWVWSINNLERFDGRSDEVERYYPGARWVDWVATSGFNWGTAYSWSSWREADALYRDTYRALLRYEKPIMISEIGTTASGGDPQRWIHDTFARLRAGYPRVRAVVWYDDIDGGGLDFRLQGQTAGALRAASALHTDWLQVPRTEALPAD